MKRDLAKLKAALLSSGALAMTGCMSVAAIEPVKTPPGNYQADLSVQVEFLHPASVGARCAERGVSLLGMSMPGALACANQNLMTVPNPCDTVTGGWYAEALCAEIGHTRGWDAEKNRAEPQLLAASWSPDQAFGFQARPAGAYRGATAMYVEFVSSQDIGLRCAERGAVAFGKPTLNALSCSSSAMMTLPNPCSVIDGGWYADLLCHEMAHANGWPANHPGGSFLKEGKVPFSHPVPDDDTFVMNFVAAIQKAQVNSRRGDPVRATVLASLAQDPAEAQQIALKAGIRQLPDVAVPRIEQIPDLVMASIVLPGERASLRPGRDFSRPMGPFAKRPAGTRLTRKSLEALFAEAPDAAPAIPDSMEGLVTEAPSGWAKLQNAALTPRLSADLGSSHLRLRGAIHLRADLAAKPSGWLPAKATQPAGLAEVDAVPETPALPEAPVITYAASAHPAPAGWPVGFGPRPWIADQIMPLLPDQD